MDADYPYPLFSAADLRTMRNQARLTREQIALFLGYSPGHIDRFQSGDVHLPDRMALKFLRLYMRTIAAHAEEWAHAA